MKEAVNVRRCHVCGEVTESEREITKCSSCRKSLLPFYYFDNRKVLDYADNQLRPQIESPGVYGPVRGLAAYWDMQNDKERSLRAT
jgi:hypothetical protein